MAYSYVVRIEVADERVFEPYVAWLRDPHLADVCAAGAEHAELVVLDVEAGAPRVVEARYRFASRDAFARYEREEAPRLRAHGLEILAGLGVAPGRGVTFTRTTGEVTATRP